MAVTSDAPSYLGLAPGVRRAALNSYDSPQLQRDQLLTEVREGRPHEDLRDWLQMVDVAGELRVLEGVDWQENIGRITEMLHHSDGAPAVLFDRIPDFPAGYRILVNAQGERRRLALSLGLPVEIGAFELMDEWERRMDSVQPLEPEIVQSGPILEN